MPQPRIAALRADIGRELSSVRRLVAEAKEWQDQLAEWPETVKVRTAGGVLHDFYGGVERTFRHIALRIDDDCRVGQTGTSNCCSAWQQASKGSGRPS
jgi:hypothetical protein